MVGSQSPVWLEYPWRFNLVGTSLIRIKCYLYIWDYLGIILNDYRFRYIWQLSTHYVLLPKHERAYIYIVLSFYGEGLWDPPIFAFIILCWQNRNRSPLFLSLYSESYMVNRSLLEHSYVILSPYIYYMHFSI